MEWSDLRFFNDGNFEATWERVQEERIKGKKVFPTNGNILRAFETTPFNDVKVVILGQDPYPTEGHAHGLAFSAADHVKPFPKSLINIFKEISSDVGSPYPETPNLLRWAEQGVLLLNTYFTVIEGLPKSHSDMGWQHLSMQSIQALSEHRDGLVFMLWGDPAKKKARYIDETKHLILTAAHPSPLSANRGGWFGCKHFSKANEYLIQQNTDPIAW